MARVLHRTSRRQRAVLAGGVVVVLVAAGVGIWLSEGLLRVPDADLRAGRGRVEHAAADGLLERDNQQAQQANLNFATSGQVTSSRPRSGRRSRPGSSWVGDLGLAVGRHHQAEATEATDAAKLSSDQADGCDQQRS